MLRVKPQDLTLYVLVCSMCGARPGRGLEEKEVVPLKEGKKEGNAFCGRYKIIVATGRPMLTRVTAFPSKHVETLQKAEALKKALEQL